MCVDALEYLPPEEWPGVLAGFVGLLAAGAPMYLTERRRVVREVLQSQVVGGRAGMLADDLPEHAEERSTPTTRRLCGLLSTAGRAGRTRTGPLAVEITHAEAEPAL